MDKATEFLRSSPVNKDLICICCLRYKSCDLHTCSKMFFFGERHRLQFIFVGYTIKPGNSVEKNKAITMDAKRQDVVRIEMASVLS